MEISSKHWTARLIKFNFGSDALLEIRDTCKYRSRLIWSFLLLPLSIVLAPLTALYSLLFKEWIPSLLTFVITFLICALGLALFTMSYWMWAEPKLFMSGIMCWVGAIFISIVLLIEYLKDQDQNVFKTLYHSYKEKYCKPIDFK